MRDTEFDRLERDYPISAEWQRPSICRHTTYIDELAIYLVGLSAMHRSGQLATGSAGQLEGVPLERAYFELIERTSVVEAIAAVGRYYQRRDYIGNLIGQADCQETFPQSENQQLWRYARSNGVAVATDWQSACLRARLELIERDRVLRSWYGESPPRGIETPPKLMPDSLARWYAIEVYLFEAREPARESAAVAGVFGFPRHISAPLVFGFGARPNESGAVAVAAAECLQRLGFLWGESIPDAQPPFSPTPDFHQEYFLYPPHQRCLREWLSGKHLQYVGVLGSDANAREPDTFVDLTPAALRSKLAVAKALPAGELPLTFGRGHPSLLAAAPGQLAIHPIA